MSAPKLQIPSDTSRSELFFDPQSFKIDFRQKDPKMATSKNALRVVVQYYGEVFEDMVFTPNSKIYAGRRGPNGIAVPIKGLKKREFFIHYTRKKRIRIKLPMGTNGVIQQRDSIKTLKDLSASSSKNNIDVYEFEHETKGLIDFDQLQIYFEETEKLNKVPAAPFAQKFGDKELYRWFTLSFLLHLILMFFLYMASSGVPDEKTLEEQSERTVEILLTTPKVVKPYEPLILQSEKAPPKPTAPTNVKSRPQEKKNKNITTSNKTKKPPKASSSGAGREGEGAKAAGDEGRRGKQSATKPITRPSMEKVKSAGVLNFFSKKQSQSGDFDDLVNEDLSDVAQNLNKRSGSNSGRYGLPGETKIKDGKGIKGKAKGGGGSSTIGQGLGTKGKGGGAKGDGLASFGTGKSKSSVKAQIDGEVESVSGGLSKEQIENVIKNYWSQIQYCYERELIRQPTLSGKVAIQFVVGLSGRVTSTSIARSTLKSSPAETCIQGVFRRMMFPDPGGSITEVVYPFNFEKVGG